MNKTRAVQSSVCIAVLVAVLFVGVWQIKPAYAATLFSDGQVGSTLETAHDFSAWSGTNGAIIASTQKPYSGSYSIKCNADYVYAHETVSTNEYYLEFWYCLNSSMTNGDVVKIGYDDNSRSTVSINATGGSVYWQFGFTDSSYVVHASLTSQTLTLNVWYHVGLWYKRNTTGGARLDVDGATILDADSTTTINEGVTSLYIADSVVSGNKVTEYFDDVTMYDVAQSLDLTAGLPSADWYVVPDGANLPLALLQYM